jgi:iron complex outermembrane receptor protein/outer membrane receptor for ferrienterochelin and colicins
VHNLKKQTIIVGTNFIYDKFSETDTLSFPKRNFKSNTGGLYAQHTWDISEKVKLESGLRGDIVYYSNQNFSQTEYFVLPRISALFKLTNKLSSRIGGGLGYKIPTVFTEQTETIQYRNVLPLNNITSEKSYGGTADLNYKTPIGEDLFFSVNQMFFYTLIDNSTVLQPDTSGKLFFANANKSVNSSGFETNLKFIYKNHLKFFVGYTFTDAKAKYLSGNQHLPLLAKNKLNLALVYEKEKFLKVGLEGYFTDRQLLTNGTQTQSFWEFGFMAEKILGKISIYVNAENFTDTRQNKYKRVVNEPHSNPTFDDIWTHTEGIVFSSGLKIKL